MPSQRRLRPALVAALAATLLAGSPTGGATADPGDPAGPVRELVGERPGGSEQPRQQARTRGERTIRVGTFNITGSIHTRGGDKARTTKVARQLRERRLGLVGLQETQPDQLRVLRNRMPGYRFSPGNVDQDQAFQLQVAWKRKRFDLRDRGFIRTPFNDTRRRTPWVTLRHKATGRRISMISVHNPSKSQEGNRDRATAQQIELYQRLRNRGVVLLVGDANEKAEWFCKVTGRTDARAANGGTNGRRGCRPPQRMSIDWLMGGGRMRWHHYSRDDVRTSDHPIIRARMTLR